MGGESIESRSLGSISLGESEHSDLSDDDEELISTRSDAEQVELDTNDAKSVHSNESSYSEYTYESEQQQSHRSEDLGSVHSEHSESVHSEHSGSVYSERSVGQYSQETMEVDDNDDESQESSDSKRKDEFTESQDLHKVESTDAESHELRSDDETDTCMLSIDEHVRRRYAKAMMRLKVKPIDAEQESKRTLSSDSDSRQDRSDDETDTCMLSIDDHVLRRQAKWKRLRDGIENETIDLTCLDSYNGTLEEETTMIAVEEETADEEESVDESATTEHRTLESLSMNSEPRGSRRKVESRTVENLPPVQEPRVDNKQGLDWRIANWRNERHMIKEAPVRKERALKGVDYMSAIDIASTNRDISVVEGGISKKAARGAFEKKEVPDEIPIMLRDDVSSIYPPIRKPARSTYPPRRKREPYNGMIMEDPLSYDEELGDDRTKEYEMSIVGSVDKKQQMVAQRSDIELLLIGMISLSLLILVILLIVILAKSG